MLELLEEEASVEEEDVSLVEEVPSALEAAPLVEEELFKREELALLTQEAKKADVNKRMGRRRFLII